MSFQKQNGVFCTGLSPGRELSSSPSCKKDLSSVGNGELVGAQTGMPRSSLRIGKLPSVASKGNSLSRVEMNEVDELGNPRGEGCGVADRALECVWGGPIAARLTQESVLLLPYGLLTDLERRKPLRDCDEEIRSSPRRRRCRFFPLAGTSGRVEATSAVKTGVPVRTSSTSAIFEVSQLCTDILVCVGY